MSFSIGTVVNPATLGDARRLGVDLSTRLVVTYDSFGDTEVKREDSGVSLGTWNTNRFVAAPAIALVPGARVTISDVDSGFHGFKPGTVVTLVALTSTEQSDKDAGYGHDFRAEGPAEWSGDNIRQWLNADHIIATTAAPAEPETLESFKVKFLNGAIARGEANGSLHSAQVTVALNTLAGLEYLEPSKTLEDFQQRIVTLAMEKKAEHSWCGEPEAYLTEIGLEHLLPVTKTLTLTSTVTVSLPRGASRADYRRAARAEVARQVALSPEDALYMPYGGDYPVRNDV